MDEALTCYATALAVVREVGNRRFEGVVLGNLGGLHLDLGRIEEARSCLESALVIHREMGSRNAGGIVLRSLALLHAREGKAAQARVELDEAETLLRATDDRLQLAVLYCCRAETEHLAAADLAAARAALGEAERLAAEVDTLPGSELGRTLARTRALVHGPDAGTAR
jgi:tetratricopeptide (TPR) repeat protein